jgi:hypothetical protein
MLGIPVSWRLAAVPAALAACGILVICWPRRDPAPAEAPMSASASPPRASALPASPAPPRLDLAAERAQLGERWLANRAAPPAAEGSHLYAIGACERTSAAETKQLARRIQRWIDARFPHEQSASGVELEVGCKSPRGIIVDVSDERGRRAKRPERETHRSFVLRARPDGLDVLAEKEAEGSDRAMEWSDEGSVETLALVDLDGDGVLDAVIDHVEHEGGARHSGHTIEAIRSTTGVRMAIASMSGELEVATRDAAPVVLGLGAEWTLEHVCLGNDGTLARCAASEAVHHAYEQDQLASNYRSLNDNEVPDADALAEQLALLDVPQPERARLVAAAPTTTDDRRAEREIARLVAAEQPRDRLDPLLHSDGKHAGAQTYFETLRGRLGDTPCAARPASAALRERAAAWVHAHTVELDRESGHCSAEHDPCDRAPATALVVTPACGPYFWVSWRDSSQAPVEHSALDHVVLFGDRMTRILARSAEVDDPNLEPTIPPAVFFQHGETIVAGVVTDDTIVAVADNRIVASRPGAWQRYSFSADWVDMSNDLLYDSGAHAVWHPTRSGFEVLTAADVVAHEARREAIELLSSFDAKLAAAPHFHADYMRALAELHAAPALVALVARLAGPTARR